MRKKHTPVFGFVMSVYAPAHGASQLEKDKFYADLQSVVDGVCMDDVLLIVSDFNARVGSGEVGGDQWDGVHEFMVRMEFELIAVSLSWWSHHLTSTASCHTSVSCNVLMGV